MEIEGSRAAAGVAMIGAIRGRRKGDLRRVLRPDPPRSALPRRENPDPRRLLL